MYIDSGHYCATSIYAELANDSILIVLQETPNLTM